MKFFRKHQKKILAALALLLALLMILPMVTTIFSASASATVTQSQIDKLKQSAAALAQQKKKLNDQLAALEDEIDSALSRKLVVEQEISVVEEQIANTASLIATYDEQIAQEEVNLADAQAEEARHFESFCQRVRVMEEQGTVSYWQILFNSADFTDLLDRVMMINEVVEYDNAVMEALEQARIQVEETKAALEADRAEQQAAKEALDAQNSELTAKRAAIDALLAEMQAKQATYERQMQSLDSQILALDGEIEKKQKEYDAQIAAGKIQFNTGSGYVWPLQGGNYTLTSLYGDRIHPLTGKPNNHLGIDIRASYGTPILAARGGVVSTSTYGQSYGNYVTISHGSGDSTRYAHMSKRAVSEGDIVKQGQVIGYVGSTGNSSGNHLHFEVFVNGSRNDPINFYPALNLWVTNNGKVVKLEH